MPLLGAASKNKLIFFYLPLCSNGVIDLDHGKGRSENFDRNVAAELCVTRAVDLAHSTRIEL
jgi:hypothetical protein